MGSRINCLLQSILEHDNKAISTAERKILIFLFFLAGVPAQASSLPRNHRESFKLKFRRKRGAVVAKSIYLLNVVSDFPGGQPFLLALIYSFKCRAFGRQASAKPWPLGHNRKKSREEQSQRAGLGAQMVKGLCTRPALRSHQLHRDDQTLMTLSMPPPETCHRYTASLSAGLTLTTLRCKPL